MPNPYLETFKRAQLSYTNREKRDGYTRTWLSYFRHFFGMTKDDVDFFTQLSQVDDKDTAKKLIEDYFTLNAKSFNNHSFGSYFLDFLQKEFPDENWKRFDPKPIIYYQGTLYRGDSRPYDKIFEEGFIEPKSSESLDDYVKGATGCIGVSTTKSFGIAHAFALPPVTSRRMEDTGFVYSHNGFVYEIDYSGTDGIDVVNTWKARGGLTFTAWFSQELQEVNVKGRIAREDIVCVHQVSRDGESERIPNPNYRKKEHKETKEVVLEKQESKSAFSMSA